YHVAERGVIRRSHAADITHRRPARIDSRTDRDRRLQLKLLLESRRDGNQLRQPVEDGKEFLPLRRTLFVQPDGHYGIADVFLGPCAALLEHFAPFAK